MALAPAEAGVEAEAEVEAEVEDFGRAGMNRTGSCDGFCNQGLTPPEYEEKRGSCVSPHLKPVSSNCETRLMEKKNQQEKTGVNRAVTAGAKACKSFSTALPMLLGIILLMGLFQTFVSSEMIAAVFSGKMIRDTFIGTVVGSISAGNPITSYIIGGELLEKGVSLFAVTAFIVAWTTVGIIQYPAEMDFLGARFATLRNIISFVLAILVAITTVTLLEVLP